MTDSRRALIVVAAFVLIALGLPWGGNVPAAQAQIQVTSANPNTADQGTLALNVTIGGKGFKKNAKANFYLKGTTNPAGITVRATKFVSDASLVATIDVAAGATPDNFDIVVANADGRTGKGTELFKVTVKIDPCTQPDPEPSFSPYVSYSPGLPGDLDGTFGNGTGRVIGPRHLQVGVVSRGPSLAIQNLAGQARIVAAGTSYDVCATGSQRVWAVARYLLDGTLDPAFGSGGVATKAFSTAGSGNVANSVAIQPDNKIVVAGRSPSRNGGLPTVVRFNVDGSLDTTFGTGGVVTLTTPGKSPSGSLNSVAIQSDGKIVAAGSAAYTPGYMVRLYPNGTIDKSFSAYTGSSGMFVAVHVQRVGAEERIVIAGGADTAHGLRPAVWRFTSTGAPDASFGGSGMVVTLFQGQDCPYCEELFNDAAIDPSNRIVAAGYASNKPDYPASNRSQSQLALARYDTAGNLDTSFWGGTVLAPSGQVYGIGTGAVLQADGRILVAGYSYDYDAAGSPVNRTVGVWRFNADGAVDTTFGRGGWASESITDGTRVAYWMGMALQPDGKIVCGGYVLMESDPAISYAALARFWQ
jgi:uncharacterized delta-60 repeat protein